MAAPRSLAEPILLLALMSNRQDKYRVYTEDERDADIDTVGGLLFTLAGRVPTRGEVISHLSGFEFRVLNADARRIRRLRAAGRRRG